VTTNERALHVLIHDIRTPVGVAQGYLRLLKEHRLSSPEEQDRALAQAQQALDRLARLCADAAALVDHTPLGAPLAVPSARLVGQVVDRLGREPVDVVTDAGAAQGVITAPVDADRLADAVANVLLAAPADRGRPRPVAIGTTGGELWFTCGTGVDGLKGDALDPWKGAGFALPLACQAIATAGGRVWAAAGGGRGTGVALPLEVSR
jgi:light-regulated signal transduction histidine kinase (bacteriophytochrome)